MKKLFTTILFIFTLLFVPISYASETCIEGTDCIESINENTYHINENFVDFTDSISEFIKVIGVYLGFMLFIGGFSIGQFIYKR